VNNSGNNANGNVTGANIEVTPDVSAKNESANVIVGNNENQNVDVNVNDNRNHADSDADARARNGNGNLNVGVNSSANDNVNANGSGRPGDSPADPSALCESYGGSFALGSGDLLWTCSGLPDLGVDGNNTRFFDLRTNACFANGGTAFGWQNDPNFPQILECGT
jgi:hypothetical protein